MVVSRRLLSLWIVASAVALGVCGCLSLAEIAPPVDEGYVADYAQREKLNVQTLTEGRRIYLTACSKCHSLEPITNYSREQWAALMPDMDMEAKLSKDQSDKLRQYIFTVLDAPLVK